MIQFCRKGQGWTLIKQNKGPVNHNKWRRSDTIERRGSDPMDKERGEPGEEGTGSKWMGNQ